MMESEQLSDSRSNNTQRSRVDDILRQVQAEVAADEEALKSANMEHE